MTDPAVASKSPAEPSKAPRRRLPPPQPFLFGLAPLLALIQQNIDEVDLFGLGWLFVGVLVLAGAVYLLVHWWRRDRHESALLASLALLAFFYYGHVHNVMIHFGVLTPYVDARAITFYALWTLALVGMLILVVRAPLPNRELGTVLKAVGLFLVAVALLPLGVSLATGDSSLSDPEFEPRPPEAAHVEARPDIMHIVLDGYGSEEVLEAVYDHSNRPFLENLRDRGFQVLDGAHSNYAATTLSLAATLNMMHLQDHWANESGAPQWIPQPDMIRNNAALTFLQDQGYEAYHIGADWTATRENPFADHDDTCKARSDFEFLFVKTTMLRIFQDALVGDERRAHILCQLDALDQLAVAEAKTPIYTFAHIVSPHPPYLFDAEGGAVKGGELDLGAAWDGRSHYIDQIRFLNTRLLATIETALDRPDPPIIILQADHGPYSIRDIELDRTLWEDFDETSLDDPLVRAAIHERMGILNAIHVPDGGPTYPDGTTPVNTYRILFDHYFDTGLGVLDDTKWFSPMYHRPAAWYDVTDLLAARKDG